ncbi:DNA polymerase III subunit delta [Lentisphaerota bacterium WC36G]|nr:DNA polymerase III subunit delta [Lentisphaerae bacterium WC36]
MKKLILVTGNDEFAIKNKVREIVSERFGEDFANNPDLEIIAGDSDELKVEEILNQLQNALETPPFLSSNKTIWLRHFVYFKDLLALKKTPLQPLIDFIKNGIPNDINLIIDGAEIDQRKAFFKECKKAGEIFNFRQADISAKDFAKNQYVKIREFCQKNNKDIAQNAVNYLAETIGSDSGRLQSELSKLINFVGKNQQQITLEDCKNICSKTPEALSWDFSNNLMKKDLPAALQVINTLIEQMRGTSGASARLELSLLANVRNSFQEMVSVKCAMHELGLNNRLNKSFFYDQAAKLKEQYPDNFLLSVHPYRAYILCSNANIFSDAKLCDILEELLHAQRKMVSGGGDPRIILEQLAVKIVA